MPATWLTLASAGAEPGEDALGRIVASRPKARIAIRPVRAGAGGGAATQGRELARGTVATRRRCRRRRSARPRRGWARDTRASAGARRRGRARPARPRAGRGTPTAPRVAFAQGGDGAATRIPAMRVSASGHRSAPATRGNSLPGQSSASSSGSALSTHDPGSSVCTRSSGAASTPLSARAIWRVRVSASPIELTTVFACRLTLART